MNRHVSTSDQNDPPDGIDDNMGGPGGLPGTTGYRCLGLTPDHLTAWAPDTRLRLTHVLENDGSLPLNLELSAVSRTGFTTGLW
jgi:hypothetical protein